MAATTTPKKAEKAAPNPIGEAAGKSKETATRLRRVFINKVFVGVFEFPAGVNVNEYVYDGLVKKHGKDYADSVTIVVAKREEDGSTMPREFKTAPKPQQAAAAPATK